MRSIIDVFESVCCVPQKAKAPNCFVSLTGWFEWRRSFNLTRHKIELPVYSPDGQTVTLSSLEQEVKVLSLWLFKSDTVLSTALNRCHISLKGAVLPGHNDAEMGLANSLQLQPNTMSIMKPFAESAF